MTSKYQQKRHRVDCALARCEEPATTLRMVNGAPQWVCQHHSEKVGKT